MQGMTKEKAPQKKEAISRLQPLIALLNETRQRHKFRNYN